MEAIQTSTAAVAADIRSRTLGATLTGCRAEGRGLMQSCCRQELQLLKGDCKSTGERIAQSVADLQTDTTAAIQSTTDGLRNMCQRLQELEAKVRFCVQGAAGAWLGML